MSLVQDNIAALTALFAFATDGVFVKDENGRYLYVNEACVQFLARPVAQILGQTDANLFEAGLHAQLREAEQKVIQTGKADSVRLHQHRRGVYESFVVTQRPFYGEDRQLLGVLGFIQVDAEPAPLPVAQTMPGYDTFVQGDLAAAPTLPQFALANLDALKLTRSLLSLQSAATAVTASLNLQYVLDTFCWELTNMLDAHATHVYEWHVEAGEAARVAYYVVEEWESAAQNYTTFVVAERPRTERVIQERYAYQFDVDNSEIAPQERQQMRDRHIGTL
ncbi:MAG: PAS domain-containing protein, partial [Anaerolineales bacterium]|nr:PAS domain-containing protein [Anaerolineales bacterium]